MVRTCEDRWAVLLILVDTSTPLHTPHTHVMAAEATARGSWGEKPDLTGRGE